jgi:ABC-type Fe3+ transport system substrate-binding protein
MKNKMCKTILRQKEWIITKPPQFWSAAALFGLLFTALWMPVPTKGAEAPGLKTLVEAARREGRLNATVVTSQGPKGGEALGEAFKRRFGLPDLKITFDLNQGTAGDAHKAIAEHQSGIPPTFDAMYFVDEAVLLLKNSKAITRIDNWESLLADIAPEAHKVRDKLSPQPIDGYAFTWGTRTNALLYNPKLIAREEVPRTLTDYGNPKYKGKYSVPPWITRAIMGTLKYDKEEWLNVVRSWGRNKAHMLAFNAGIDRLLLGELSFLSANAYYYYAEKDKDKNAPIGLSFFEDLTTLHRAMNVVMEGSRHPNAAKLFTLWSVGEEASLLFHEYSYAPNVYLGKRGPLSTAIVNEFEKRNIKPVTWFDTPQTVKEFLWYETAEGKKYAQAIDRAQREGK